MYVHKLHLHWDTLRLKSKMYSNGSVPFLMVYVFMYDVGHYNLAYSSTQHAVIISKQNINFKLSHKVSASAFSVSS